MGGLPATGNWGRHATAGTWGGVSRAAGDMRAWPLRPKAASSPTAVKVAEV